MTIPLETLGRLLNVKPSVLGKAFSLGLSKGSVQHLLKLIVKCK